MKIVLLSAKAEDKLLASLKSSFKDAEIAILNLSENPDLSILKGSDIALNLIGGQEFDTLALSEMDNRLGINSKLAEISLNTVAVFEIVELLDKAAQAIAKFHPSVVLNAAYPIDMITLYLYKAHNITSYGISLKANNLLQTFLAATGLGKIKVASYKAAGRLGNAWITEVADAKGGDLYPQARENVANISLDLKRHALTADSLRSLRFYGYYHSANTPNEEIEPACTAAIQKIFSKEKTTVYLGAINNDCLQDYDSKALVEIPFECSKGKLKAEKATLPLPCALALNDYISALSVAASALQKRSLTLFKRTVKLDPYLASILSLAELEAYARSLASTYNLEKVFAQEAL